MITFVKRQTQAPKQIPAVVATSAYCKPQNWRVCVCVYLPPAPPPRAPAASETSNKPLDKNCGTSVVKSVSRHNGHHGASRRFQFRCRFVGLVPTGGKSRAWTTVPPFHINISLPSNITDQSITRQPLSSPPASSRRAFSACPTPS